MNGEDMLNIFLIALGIGMALGMLYLYKRSHKSGGYVDAPDGANTGQKGRRGDDWDKDSDGGER